MRASQVMGPFINRTIIDILTLLGLPKYGTHYHRKLSRLPHLICLKRAFSIFMFLRDQVVSLRVRIQVISSGVL